MEKSSKKVHHSENLIAERLKAAIAALGYRYVSNFIEALDVKKSTVYAILNGSTKDPGTKILRKFYYVGINLNWLITGDGEMLLPDAAMQKQATKGPIEGTPKPYPTREESKNIEEKIKDAVDDIIGMYEQLRQMRQYASEIDSLPPEQIEIFHRLVRTFLDSAKKA